MKTRLSCISFKGSSKFKLHTRQFTLKKKLRTYLSAIRPFVNVKHSIYSERIEMAFYIPDTWMKFNTEINLMRKRLKRLHGTRSNAYCND